MTNYWIKKLAQTLGVEQNTTSHTEKIISSLGGLLGIAVVYLLSLRLEGAVPSVLIVASIGASAVLVFAIPHGALSQPWPVMGGHIISAIIGVMCFRSFGNTIVAGSAAVGLAILFMYYLRCLHPPGGATALLAVIGGEPIHNMGFSFAIDPILTNVTMLLLTAFVFNLLFRQGSNPANKPARYQRLSSHPHAVATHHLTLEDFTAALQQLDSFIDVSTEDLSDIFERAIQHTQSNNCLITPNSITAGCFYSNGKLGLTWSIRQVTKCSGKQLHYTIVSGHGKGEHSTCSRKQFSAWATYKVIPQEKHWVRELHLLEEEECQPC